MHATQLTVKNVIGYFFFEFGVRSVARALIIMIHSTQIRASDARYLVVTPSHDLQHAREVVP